ncbi:porin family protein [Labrys sp. KNU-23]|uniref:outer membrane protein n=1 Tax=Labrys sp. KNU-23 TaxID=2789216 RepID=UPI0011ECE236|nr:outer membrane protein [Labrys sp. KNU-23]QEN86002.1 porin family protein [Labrys sp. KNU-23]
MFKAVFVPTVMAVALFAGAASAADLAPHAVEPVAPAYTPYNWSGPYIGVHAGYGWGREDDNQSRLFSENGPVSTNTAADKFNMNGFVGGAHAGYNYQIDQFVIGGEADIDYTDLKGNHRYSYSGGSVTGRLQMKSEWQGSLRLRAGYAFDNLLVYATGGVAFANGKLSDRGVNGASSDSNTHTGWTVGLGAEYAFTQNWIGRAEVRYSDFQKKGYDTPNGRVKAGWNQTTATLGISYKF